PLPGLVVALEEREVDDPVEELLAGLREVELARQVQAEPPEDARGDGLIVGDEERGAPRLGLERLQLLRREELRDRRPDLAGVVDEVGQPLRAPLLRDFLEAAELGPGESPRRDEVSNRRRL